jgi:xylulokinase
VSSVRFAGRRVVAGVDSSTQSVKIVYCDAGTGEVLDTATAPHPDGTSVDPRAWTAALESILDLDGVSAVSVAGQQHGLVTVDADGEPVRDALLWNDLRSAPQALALTAELGAQGWADRVGSAPLASLTITKLAWLAENETELASRVDAVLLPHDWLTWQLRGRPAGDYTTDRSDASGTGYFSSDDNGYCEDLLQLAFGRVPLVPRVLGPAVAAGSTSGGVVVGPGAGDNAGAALGLGLSSGELAVSLGTSGAAFASASSVTPTVGLNRFADATGRLLPLSCTLNAARVLTSSAELLGVDLTRWESLASSAPLDADGLILLPYLDGERTPDLPDARGSLHGMTRSTMTPAHLARAALLGMLCGLADAVDVVRNAGVPVRSVVLIGGAAESSAVRSAAADIFGVPVRVPEPAQYVALGAARQAAWVLAGSANPPDWPRPLAHQLEPSGDGWAHRVRSGYAEARDALYPR